MASVHITDFGSAAVNPQPIPVEVTEFLLEDYLSSAKMKEMSGVDDLDDVKYLEMRVDTTETSLGNFGTMVPNLKYLKLSNSIIATVRDLGTSLENLQVVWLPRCSLSDLDGIGSMSSLQELYLAYNDISDLSSCSMLECLQLLDLEGNNIDDMSQVEFLSLCPKLNTLTLEGNPVCQAPSVGYDKEEEGEFDYRAATSRAVPQLRILDDDPLSITPSSLGTTSANISMEWLLVNEAIKDQGSNEKLEVKDCRPETARPSSASRQRPSSARPGSSSGRPGSSLGSRPGTASGRRPGTSQGERPDTGGSDIHPTQEDASDLTHGSGGVMCGNPITALRKRRRTNKDKVTAYQAPSLFSMFQHQPEHSYILEEEDDGKSKEDIFAELKEWKEQHEAKILSRIKESEPQVLKIHHSTSDEDDDNETHPDYFTNNNHLGYDEDYGIDASPSPTSDYPESLASRELDQEPTPPHSLSPRIPQAPKSRAVRPKTANDFRSRRVRVRSFEEHQGLYQHLQHMCVSMDDDIDHNDSGQTSPASIPYSPPPIVPIENRPFSGPIIGTRKFKINPPNVLPEPKNIDHRQPVIRSSVNTPPNLAHRLSRLARPSTARAAMQLQRPPTLPPRQPHYNSYDFS